MNIRARILVIGAMVVSFMPRPAHAMTTLFLDGPAAVHPGEDAVYAIRATLTQPVNAVGLTFDFDATAVAGVRFAARDSVIRQWLEPPTVREDVIRLDGIIPGGTAPVFTDTVPIGYVTLRFTRSGTTVLRLSDAEVFLHQPVPAKDVVAVHPLSVRVTDRAEPVSGTPPPGVEDVYAVVTRDPSLLGGAWTLVFDVRTAEGPAATVMLRERFLGLFGDWREISSPASLSDQLRLSILEIGIPDGGKIRILNRIVPTRLVVMASVLGAAGLAYFVRRLMKR